MASRLGWFLVGVLSGMALLAAVKRIQEEQETEDVEALAESISERLSALESDISRN